MDVCRDVYKRQESVERHLKKMYSDYIYELINNIEPSNSLNDDKTIIEDWFCHVYFDKKEILEDLNKFLKGVQELVEKNKPVSYTHLDVYKRQL